MFYLIKKDTLAVARTWDTLPRRIHFPGGGDVMFSPTAPTDVGPDHVLREAEVTDFEPFDPATEVRNGPDVVVSPTLNVTETWAVRAKTQIELDADQRSKDLVGLQDAGKDIALVLTELIDWTLTNTAMQATDFTSGVRQAYQDLKAIADRVK